MRDEIAFRFFFFFLIEMILRTVSSTHQLEQNDFYLTGTYAIHNNYK